MEGLPISNQLSVPSVVTQIIAGTNITIDQPNGNVTVNSSGGGPGSGVLSLEGLEGAVTLSSPGGAIGITVNGQDIELTSNGVLSVTGGSGISVDVAGGDASLSNTGVLSVSDGTTVSTGAIVLSASSGVSAVNTAGTFAITNTGVTELTGGDGIGLDVQTGSVTVSNLGVLSVAALTGAVTLSGTNVSITPAGNNIDFAVSFPSPPVTSVNAQTGAILIEAGSGITVTNSGTPSIQIANDGVLSVSAGTGMSASTAAGVATVTSISRQFTLGGATVGGVITYSKASGSGNTWTSSTWTLMNTIQINVPTGWAAGQSVGFDGFEYVNWDSNTTSYFTIYYVTPSQATEQSLIGDRTSGFTDAIFGNNSGQAYLPLNLTIPPTYLVSGQTITLRIYGYVTAALHYMVSDPLIDARVNIVYP